MTISNLSGFHYLFLNIAFFLLYHRIYKILLNFVQTVKKVPFLTDAISLFFK